MGLFTRHKTLSQAIRADDIRTVRKKLERGVDPNICDPEDTAWPIHYALNHGPEMVELLIQHGADVNISARGGTPLAKAEARGLTEVAALLREAGARLRGHEDDLVIDPRIRLQIEPQISSLVVMASIHFHTEPAERIAEIVESKLQLQFPPDMSPQEKQDLRRDIRTLIIRECAKQGRP